MTLKDKLQHIMERAVENCEVAGVNLLIEQDGEELCYCQAGMADIEENRSMSRDTIFRLYSQTKPITAAAAMILMERGELDLRQSVSDFLPAFTAQFPTSIRVFDLLRMTSGLLYPNDTSEAGRQAAAVFEEMDKRLYTDQAMTTQEVANALAGCVLAFEPGTSWEYGTSADVLGAVIEVVSGMKFGEFLDKEIFRPLGMKDTAFWVPEEKQNRLAAAYETIIGAEKNSLLRYEGNNLAIRNKMDRPPAFESGGAGLASTLDDYMRFAGMLLREGTLDGTQILKPAAVRYLTSGELMDSQQNAFDKWLGLEGYSYGNLMRVCKNPDRTGYLARKGEYGWDGWLGLYFANFPEEKLTILMGTQKKDGGTFPLTIKLRNVLLSELL